MKIDILNPETVQNISRQYELYQMFSQLTMSQQEEAIKAMGLSAEDERTFRLSMAYMKLFCNKPYQRAVKKAMAETLYEEFNRKS